MDHFYAFLIFAVLLVVEQMARAAWLPLYYRLGMPVNLTNKKLSMPTLPPDESAPASFTPAVLEKELQEQFKSNPQYPSIRFKALNRPPAGGKPVQQVEIAFHEAPFEARRGFRYLPVMHSRARIDRGLGVITVSGLIDWYVVFTLVYLVLTALDDHSFIPVAILVLLVFGMSYLGQSAVNRLVVDRINSFFSDEVVEEK